MTDNIILMKKRQNTHTITIPNRTKVVTAILLFLLVFLVYLTITSHYALGYGDSSEMITAAFTKGIPHPPAYPLYMLIGYFFTHIPFLNPAYGLNISSGLFHSLAVVLIYLSSTHLLVYIFDHTKEDESSTILQKNIASIAGSLILAFSYLFFLYSGITEVFPLNDFFIALVLYLCLLFKYFWEKDVKTSYIVFFVLCAAVGLMLSNQQVSILIIPAISIFITALYLQDKKKLWKNIFIAVCGILVSFIFFILPYFYLPTLSHSGSLLSWRNPTSAQDIINIILRKDFGSSGVGGSYNSHIDIGTQFAEIPHYVGFLLNHFLWTFPFALLGIVFILMKKKKKWYGYDIAFLLFFSFLIAGIFLSSYTAIPWDSEAGQATLITDIGIHLRLYLQSEVIFSLFIPIGIFGLIRYLWKKKQTIWIYFAVFLLPISLLGYNWMGVNNSHNDIYEYIAYQTLRTLPSKSFLICFADVDCFSYEYQQQVKGIRKDDVIIIPVSVSKYKTTILQHYPNIFKTKINADQAIIRDIIARDVTSYPIFLSFVPNTTLDAIGVSGNPYYTIPYGYLLKVVKDPGSFTTKQFQESENISKTIDTKLAGITPDERDFSKQSIRQSYAVQHALIAFTLFNEGYADFAQAELQHAKDLQSTNLTPISELDSYMQQYNPGTPVIEDFSYYYQKGTEDLAQNDSKDAEGFLLSALMLNPDDQKTKEYLLLCYQKNGQTNEYSQSKLDINN